MNRPVGNHRPVFMVLFSMLLCFSILASSTPMVQANSLKMPTPKTTPAANGITIPASGEPVILLPGDNARLVSPMRLQILTQPGEDGLVRVELLGHDNRLIFRKLLDYAEYKGKTLLLEEEIPFEVRSDEPARLQIVLENAKGKVVFLSSVRLTLLAVKGTETAGEKAVNPRIKIELPVSGTSVVGKELVIKAGIKPINSNPIIIEVLAADWHTLTSKILTIDPPADQTAFTPIDVKLPFKTGTDLPVTLRIRQDSNTLITGSVLMWSEKITLTP
jgi:hypothetical protein